MHMCTYNHYPQLCRSHHWRKERSCKVLKITTIFRISVKLVVSVAIEAVVVVVVVMVVVVVVMVLVLVAV